MSESKFFYAISTKGNVMNTLDVRLSLANLHCYDEADGAGSAEPYLWTVFFKIDGDTTVVNSQLALQGTATVIGRPGNHHDLPNQNVNAGDNVPIPAVLGEFDLRLKPIPLQSPVGSVTAVGGVVGIIAVLNEQDDTSDSAIAAGHNALDKAVRDSLNALIPTLTFTHQEPTDAEIKAMTKKISDTVLAAIKNNVATWDFLKVAGDMDDPLGNAMFYFSHSDLEARGISGIGFQQRFTNSDGDWELQGRATASPVGVTTGSLHIAISGIPNTGTIFPVTVSGPGLSQSLNKDTTFTKLLPGTYTIRASNFTTGQPGKPGHQIHVAHPASQQVTVTAGQVANPKVTYTSIVDDPIRNRRDR
ncbi:MAG TPA: hypothetical protein VF516_25865 [Kofleriaceae bacterium]